MTPKELMENAIEYTGQSLAGVFEKKDQDGDVTGNYVTDSNGRELIVYPGDYLVRDNPHKLTFEVVRAAYIPFQTRDGGEG